MRYVDARAACCVLLKKQARREGERTQGSWCSNSVTTPPLPTSLVHLHYCVVDCDLHANFCEENQHILDDDIHQQLSRELFIGSTRYEREGWLIIVVLLI